jgi:hypothetical protein
MGTGANPQQTVHQFQRQASKTKNQKLKTKNQK